jgi:hypothetical protein
MRFLKSVLVGWVILVASSVAAALTVRRRIPSFGSEEDAEFSVVAAMDGIVFEARSQHFGEARAVAFMGGIELDLTDAGLVPGAYLTLRAVMGGIDVVVPSDWRIEVMGRSVMGGIGNLTDPDAVGEDAPLLLIDAFAVMGGIEIHSQETI